jgi:hypothetical protein
MASRQTNAKTKLSQCARQCKTPDVLVGNAKERYPKKRFVYGLARGKDFAGDLL